MEAACSAGYSNGMLLALLLACRPESRCASDPVEPDEAAFVAVLSDFTVGGVALGDASGNFGEPVYATSGDAIVRVFDDLIVVVERFGIDAITALDASEPSEVVWQSALPERANVHDVELRDGALWLTSYRTSEILRIDPADGSALPPIDLGHVADADGSAELDAMVSVGDRLFVAAQQLDRSVSPWSGDAGLLVELGADGPIAEFELGANPRVFEAGDQILVADGLLVPAGGVLPERASDGVVRLFDPADGTLSEPLFVEDGEDVYTAVVTDTHAVLLTVAADASTGLACIDLESLPVTRGPTDTGWFYTGVVRNGEVWVGRRGMGEPGGFSRIDLGSCMPVASPGCVVLDPYDLAAL